MTVYNVLLKIVYIVDCKSSGREKHKEEKKKGKKIKDSRMLTWMPSSIMNHVPTFISRDASMECLIAHGCSTGLKSGALAAHWLSYF